MTDELMLSLISKISEPGNTVFELLAIAVLVGFLVWRGRKK